ncbi:response regulator transcription factor [Novosphingobium mangrovi (ex Huang et al. 2023)]|uniref:LuxR C-terminal-related transcriptional regulator n=1 Tax=Novosphingobium mangrovi (ex Huang et al. 2023) TaxID=2976432 RepID=A0ABT2I051_9SPHN|nr:LuxR C-terminal-related transcriptional regulator [Novosphingobium mangrovi (ex Huang et al. 2023)]MCT2398185.1 LuxR C-terminal-related transcriptional regulator [Novosphingobium mangrovi (ex Huang et al. 2023)]
MERISNLILIDDDTRRRAIISHALAMGGIHVEPFETTCELADAWPRTGIILIHDRPSAIEDLIEAMAAHGQWFPIVAFSEGPSTRRIVQAVLGGAVDYLAWPVTADELSTTVGGSIDRAAGIGNARLREVMAQARIERLTRREREVLGGVASGLSNRLIGERLEISPRTVEIHRANMLNKLGANHTSDAIRIAIEASLVG